MESPIAAQTVTTSHSMRKSDTLRTLVAAMIRPDSPGATKPTPMVVSASTRTPVAVSNSGGGREAIQSRIDVRKSTHIAYTVLASHETMFAHHTATVACNPRGQG